MWSPASKLAKSTWKLLKTPQDSSSCRSLGLSGNGRAKPEAVTESKSLAECHLRLPFSRLGVLHINIYGALKYWLKLDRRRHAVLKKQPQRILGHQRKVSRSRMQIIYVFDQAAIGVESLTGRYSEAARYLRLQTWRDRGGGGGQLEQLSPTLTGRRLRSYSCPLEKDYEAPRYIHMATQSHRTTGSESNSEALHLIEDLIWLVEIEHSFRLILEERTTGNEFKDLGFVH
ncbi:hypothetical protein F5146DRAFT_1001473 [Armillaria mellea]|nr:hypothetical protein F5146DRAFT_1001473 [Armillaria mellea]